jgi:hypothetical protein
MAHWRTGALAHWRTGALAVAVAVQVFCLLGLNLPLIGYYFVIKKEKCLYFERVSGGIYTVLGLFKSG